ncbi:MAG: hybrid sensor histidine kinase/response regulator [Candidatus Omnitrophica bacterium]|nr:hybrid sensor histidine kinase/response regulator [Candidatus Omnitrophota bacterium]
MVFDKSKFIEGFKVETREHLQALSLGLLKLEKAPQNHELLNSMMREAHTIKGSATMMGYKRIADLGHEMESGLEKALNKEIKLEKKHIDILLKCLDAIEGFLEDKVTWEEKGIERPFAEELCRQVKEEFSEKHEKKTHKSKDGIIHEEIIAAPVLTEEPKVAKSTISNDVAAAIEGSLRVDKAKLDKLMNLSGELLISKIRLDDVVKNLSDKADLEGINDEALSNLVSDLRSVDGLISFLTGEIQDEVMNVRMLPVSTLFNTFPRSMRDLAQTKGKEINFELRGEEAQLDKTIIDELKDPIMHLLRNSVDHGIESPEERLSKNKPREGKIILSACQEGSQIVISVSDDGNGIDINKVKEQAVARGLVASEKIKELADEQAMQLIFTPGFSTQKVVTDISGRGVGLDVVRERVVKLKGTVEVNSQIGIGAKFTMKFPLTLAVTESLLVAAGTDTFAIPIDTVVETIRVNVEDVKTVETKEAITVRGHILPLVRLCDLFGLCKRGIFEKRFFSVVVVQSVEKRIGILVDELLGRLDIVTKSLGEPLKKVKNISGATILGNGEVILILDIPSIIESSEGVIVRRPVSVSQPELKGKKKKTILLAEDVLSTAMLEKNILESVGYSVVIARDGKEALDRASQEKFDLVITDVLMPKMDGFELTSRLKKDNIYKDVPVVIVTTRESDADKRRGLEAGAEAYILKSDFTSEGLLETLERLIG